MQVHDELVYELSEKESEAIARKIKDVMETVVSPEKLEGVPIVVEVKMGKNWGELTPVK
jgi:DNA polymerase-1